MPIEVSHGDRVVYPASGHTKADVVRHYERVAERLLYHVAGRPLTLRRYPRGVGVPGFFQKNVPEHYPASIARLEVGRREGQTLYPVVSEPGQLAYLANQGVIELHVPTVRAGALGSPDRFVIDLDPPAGALALVRAAARQVGEALAAWGLPTALVATGSKGYHLIGALRPLAPAERLAEVAQKAALLLEQAHGDTLTTAFRVSRRGGRVFLDWMRNLPLATVVAPLSLRARPRPTVACPIGWDELDRLAPDAFDLDTIGERLQGEDAVAALDARPTDAAAFLDAVEQAFSRSGLELLPFDRFRS